MAPNDIAKHLRPESFRAVRVYVFGGSRYEIIDPLHASVNQMGLLKNLEERPLASSFPRRRESRNAHEHSGEPTGFPPSRERRRGELDVFQRSQMEMYIGVDPDETGLPTRSVYFDCRHITRIEPSPQGVPGSNGDGPQDAQE